MALRAAFVVLLTVLAVLHVPAQMVSSPTKPGEATCTVSAVSVTVTDPSGGVIQNALVLLYVEPLRLEELRTNSGGKATASPPCGYVDVFVAANGFTPHAEKLLARESTSITVALSVYPVVMY
jgi:hypothetical protein